MKRLRPKNFFNANRSAFTLVELLVVIAIIGLLSSVAVVSMTGARTKARDAKRLGDMKQIVSALELYYSDNASYPICAGSNTVCTTTGYSGDLSTLAIKPTYMGVFPSDPKNVSTQYGYYYARGYNVNGCGYTYVNTATSYILATRMENSALGNCPGGFTGWDNGSLNYLTGTQP